MWHAGHSIERRRDGKGNTIELLRDVDGQLLAIAFPVWDAVAGEYIREVLLPRMACAALHLVNIVRTGHRCVHGPHVQTASKKQ